MAPKISCSKVRSRYAVKRDGVVIGWVWRSTSGAVWGSLSCSPRTKVWAWCLGADSYVANGSRGSRRAAVADVVEVFGRTQARANH